MTSDRIHLWSGPVTNSASGSGPVNGASPKCSLPGRTPHSAKWPCPPQAPVSPLGQDESRGVAVVGGGTIKGPWGGRKHGKRPSSCPKSRIPTTGGLCLSVLAPRLDRWPNEVGKLRPRALSATRGPVFCIQLALGTAPRASTQRLLVATGLCQGPLRSLLNGWGNCLEGWPGLVGDSGRAPAPSRPALA